ncbi:MAG: GSU2403 family nucleotidyltransferase fold protein [Thermodesulfobacteriota bacterium]
MDRMPLEIQTLYAELMERLSALEAGRSIGHVPGSFVTKAVKGDTYYYFQYFDPGGSKRQIYIGRKDKILEEVVKKYREERASLAEEEAGIQRLCTLLRAGGALLNDSASARVLKALSDAGIFRLGAVLIGTQAFLVLGNLLGVRWTGGSIRTQDIDIAAEASLSLAIPDLRTNIPDVLEGLQMGFLPVPPLDPRKPSTSFKVRGKGLRLDLLTPLRGRQRQGPVFITRLNAAARPLSFLDFLITRPVRGAVIDGGGILVNLPDPARLAFHKLIVSAERETVMHTKREKDLHQAAQLFSILAEERPGDIRMVLEEIHLKGKGWVKRIREGLSALKKMDPTVAEKMTPFLSR